MGPSRRRFGRLRRFGRGAGVAVVAMLSACDSPDAAPTSTLPDCTLTEKAIVWSNLEVRDRLTGVVLFDGHGKRLDSWLQPVEPAVSGAGVPAQWQSALLSSLGLKAGKKLAAVPTDTDVETIGTAPLAEGQTDRQVGFETATSVTGTFTVSCPGDTVSGTAVSWTGGTQDNVPCESVTGIGEGPWDFLSPFCAPNADLSAINGPITVDLAGVLPPDTISVN